MRGALAIAALVALAGCQRPAGDSHSGPDAVRPQAGATGATVRRARIAAPVRTAAPARTVATVAGSPATAVDLEDLRHGNETLLPPPQDLPLLGS